MMKAIAFKLVLRCWWRNKTFSVISIGSLAIGIACANLLGAFVIHEVNLERDNPNRDRIYYMDQESPMKSGERVSFVHGDIPVRLQEKYPEVENYLRMRSLTMGHITIDNCRYDPPCMVSVDPSFPDFFPFHVIKGDLQQVLAGPGQIALTESSARKYFGNVNPLGKTILLSPDDFSDITADQSYRIGAIVADRDQSFIHFEMLTANTEGFPGGVTLVLMSQAKVDREKLAARIKADGIETFVKDGSYRFDSFLDSYFKEYNIEYINFVQRGQADLLYISFLAAVLILLIACFNYINLSFSRLLQQVRMIHTEKLMGASIREIGSQLFIDTFLTVILAFLLSLLIIHDLIPLFNSVVSSQLRTSFLFNIQVLPLTVGFILLLSILPAYYISRKISGLTSSGYREFFTGQKKRRIVTTLSVIQYTISIALICATLTVNSQLHFIRQGGERYKNLIEAGNYMIPSNIPEFVDELKKHPEIQDAAATGGATLSFGLTPLIIKHPDGSESHYSRAQYLGGPDFLQTLQLDVQQGLPPEKALERFDNPVYITQKYADILIPKGEDPVGKEMSTYDELFKNETDSGSDKPCIIAGIIENIYAGSMAEEVFPGIVYIERDISKKARFAEIKLGSDREASLAVVRAAWKKVNPDKYFTYTDIYNEYMMRNRKSVDLSNLLTMYSLISLFLTCFGLFGMALYATEQRTKEIGIRKINGAGTLHIMLLLNKQFVVWIGLAFILAVPLSWLWLYRWLEGFVYRTNLSPIHFVLAGLFTLVITLLTVSWHTYKAASGNPVESLKSE